MSAGAGAPLWVATAAIVAQKAKVCALPQQLTGPHLVVHWLEKPMHTGINKLLFPHQQHTPLLVLCPTHHHMAARAGKNSTQTH